MLFTVCGDGIVDAVVGFSEVAACIQSKIDRQEHTVTACLRTPCHVRFGKRDGLPPRVSVLVCCGTSVSWHVRVAVCAWCDVCVCMVCVSWCDVCVRGVWAPQWAPYLGATRLLRLVGTER